MATLQEIYAIIRPQNPVMGRVMAALVKASWAVLVEDAEMCPHGRLLKNWKWLALGILLGVSIVAGSSSAVTALVLKVF